MDVVQRLLMLILMCICISCLTVLQSGIDYSKILAFRIALNQLACSLPQRKQKRRCVREIWSRPRVQGYVERYLLGSYSAKMFKEQQRVSVETFKFICSRVAPYMEKRDTRFRMAIPLETRVCIALTRLATGNSLITISDTYGVGVSTCQNIIIDFAESLKKALHSYCIKWPTSSGMFRLAAEFENLKGIPNVIGAIDVSHIPIIAPSKHAQDYFNRKGFYSVLLQMVVSANCLIWDYDLGWAGSINDWSLFQRSYIGRMCRDGALGDFCLVGDAEYPPRYWMLSPFKDHKDGLSEKEYFWNYVQSSTRMAVDHAIGILKARWRILVKRIDVKLANVPPMVVACLILHNLCIILKDSFDDSWLQEVEVDLRLASSHTTGGGVMEREVANASAEALYEIQGMLMSEEEHIARSQTNTEIHSSSSEEDCSSDDEANIRRHINEDNGFSDSVGVCRRESLVDALFEKYKQDTLGGKLSSLHENS